MKDHHKITYNSSPGTLNPDPRAFFQGASFRRVPGPLPHEFLTKHVFSKTFDKQHMVEIFLNIIPMLLTS